MLHRTVGVDTVWDCPCLTLVCIPWPPFPLVLKTSVPTTRPVAMAPADACPLVAVAGNFSHLTVLSTQLCVRKSPLQGRLGGSVGYTSDFGLAHDLVVCEFEPCVGLFGEAWSLEPALDPVSLSLCPSSACSLSLKYK